MGLNPVPGILLVGIIKHAFHTLCSIDIVQLTNVFVLTMAVRLNAYENSCFTKSWSPCNQNSGQPLVKSLDTNV